MSAIVKYVKSLNLTFSDSKKEKEYMTIQRQNLATDFYVTVLVVSLTLVTVVIQKITEEKWQEVIIAGSTLGLFLVWTVIGKFSRKYIEYLTILVIISYNVYRLVLMSVNWKTQSKVNLFMGGYTYAVLQTILVSRIPNIYYRILAVIVAYIVRFAVFIIFIDDATLQAGLMIRAIIVDYFVLYFFHSGEKIDRKVFQNFDEKREELLKFKELLDDSLPQAVTIVDSQTLSPLFSNVAFLDLHKESMYAEEFGDSKFIAVNNEKAVCYLNLLDADFNTLREMGAPQPNLKTFDPKKNVKALSGLIRELVRNSILSKKAISLIASHKTNGQSTKSFEVILKRIRWDGVDALAVILNDITYQENLVYFKMASANKDKIIATVSHELRTPLHGIIGLLHMTEQRVDEPQALEYISLCKDNANLLMSLVNSILDLQQISTGKLKLNISKTEVRKSFDDVIRLFKFQTNQKGIFMNLSIEDEVPVYINTDENRLKQIIINLIGNAIKFTSKGGVTVRVIGDVLDSNFMKISVIDTGIGIKDEDKEKLFKMYSRLEDGVSVNKNGVGLGLTISNALAVILSNKKEENGIEVKSCYGEGTEFSFKIMKELTNRICSEDEHDLAMIMKDHVKRQKSCENLTEESSLDLIDVSCKLTNYQIKPSLMALQTDRGLITKCSNKKGVCSRTKVEDLQAEKTPSSLLGIQQQESSESPTQMKTDKTERGPLLLKQSDSSNLIPQPQKSFIVIVDDNSFNLLIAQNLIKETGYEVKTAMGGYEAIEAIKNLVKEAKAIKAILMDCQMPIIDGYDTTRILVKMMSNQEIPKIPVIALTANNSEDDIKRCYDCGMSGHLTKPSSKNALIQCLSNLH